MESSGEEIRALAAALKEQAAQIQKVNNQLTSGKPTQRVVSIEE